VSGSSPKAEDGTLTIMAGGAESDFERARPFFDAMGENILHVGPLGHGQTVKVISNAVAATNAATLAQALVVGRATGVDLEALAAVLGSSAAASTMVTLKAKPMLAHDYTPLFRLAHMLKDVDICLDESAAAQAAFPSAALARELYRAGMRRGLGDDDFAAVLEVVEGITGARL
jgi:3-hydroxyisobutyrate dehydrogenase-like beta-hydroxyacid dehydrogenase